MRGSTLHDRRYAWVSCCVWSAVGVGVLSILAIARDVPRKATGVRVEAQDIGADRPAAAESTAVHADVLQSEFERFPQGVTIAVTQAEYPELYSLVAGQAPGPGQPDTDPGTAAIPTGPAPRSVWTQGGVVVLDEQPDGGRSLWLVMAPRDREGDSPVEQGVALGARITADSVAVLALDRRLLASFVDGGEGRPGEQAESGRGGYWSVPLRERGLSGEVARMPIGVEVPLTATRFPNVHRLVREGIAAAQADPAGEFFASDSDRESASSRVRVTWTPGGAVALVRGVGDDTMQLLISSFDREHPGPAVPEIALSVAITGDESQVQALNYDSLHRFFDGGSDADGLIGTQDHQPAFEGGIANADSGQASWYAPASPDSDIPQTLESLQCHLTNLGGYCVVIIDKWVGICSISISPLGIGCKWDSPVK